MTSLYDPIGCSKCNAGLSDVPLDGACVACGTPVAESLNVAVIDPATRTVAADVPCIACGYSLRMLAIIARCPECATPAHRSLRPDDLRFADPRWLRRIRTGTSVLGASLAVGLLKYVTDILGMIGPFVPIAWRARRVVLTFLPIQYLGLIGLGLWLAGVVVLARTHGSTARWSTS